MGSVNKVILLGNLGQDPDIRTTPSGQQVATLSIATSETWMGKDGKREERTEWHRVILWGRLAELAGKYLKKGRKVYIEGRLQTTSWEEQGQKRYRTEIVAREMTFIDSGNGRDGAMESNAYAGGGYAGTSPTASASASYDIPPPSAVLDDDVPF